MAQDGASTSPLKSPFQRLTPLQINSLLQLARGSCKLVCAFSYVSEAGMGTLTFPGMPWVASSGLVIVLWGIPLAPSSSSMDQTRS